MADVQIAVIDQQNTQIALAAPSETEVTVAVPGVQGPVGEGVPAGGTANQVLFKQSGTDYDTAWSEITSEMIGDLEIVNADVAANAEIAVSKLADGAARQLLQTDAAGTGVEWTDNVDVPGTLDVTGAATFDSSVAVTGTLTKSGNNVVTVGDTGTVTSTMILDGTIVNDDVNVSAAIAGTKISPNFGSQNITTTGTATAAALIPSGSSVPTNGVYLPSANNVAISTNGTQRLLIDSSGNISLGPLSGATGLTNLRGSSFHQFVVANDLIVDTTPLDGEIIFRRNGGASESMRIDGSGRLGLGTSSPTSELTIFHATDPEINFNINVHGTAGKLLANSDGLSIFGGGLGEQLRFYTNNLERARIDSSGRVGIGTTSPAAPLHVVGPDSNAQIILTAGSATSNIAQIAATNEAASVWNQLDIRAHEIAFDTAGTERARIDSSGRLLVGTSTATTFGTSVPALQVQGDNFSNSTIALRRSAAGTTGPSVLFACSNGTVASPTIVADNDELGKFRFYGYDGSSFSPFAAEISVHVDGTPGANDMPGRLVFSTTADGASSPTERMRIDSDGTLLVGKTTSANGTAGSYFKATGFAAYTRDASTVGYFNRLSDDGTIIDFAQGTVSEGSISVSGTTISYNGAHLSRWSQLVGIDPYDKNARPEILRGTVMSNLDEMCDWTCPESGDCQDNEQLNKTEISSVDDDPNVAGVFQSWDDDDDTWVNDYYLAMTGDFVIRIAAGTTVQRGDLLCSAGDGTARPQGDRYIKDSTIAKVTSTTVSCTHPDGSYCVPCVLMAC